MNKYILVFKSWYENRILREQLLVLGLAWALLYALFSLMLFRPLDLEEKTLSADIKQLNDDTKTWEAQINTLKKISTTTLYSEWKNHHQAFLKLQEQYKYLLQNSSTKQWQDVIKTILQSKSNITLVEIKNQPEAVYNPSNAKDIANTIFQQQLSLTILSDYFDTLSYLKQLEMTLPNIHWNNLQYNVTEYPIAKVEMEFSILYEKNI